MYYKSFPIVNYASVCSVAYDGYFTILAYHPS